MYIPIRSCIACRHKGPKEDFFRIVFSADSKTPSLDRTKKSGGRGAYICKSIACINLAHKKNALSRALRHPVCPNIYDILTEELCEQ